MKTVGTEFVSQEGYGQDQAQGDTPAQLEPDGEQRDLAPDPLTLGVAAIKIVRQDSQH
jgi:hypothetical protein